MPNWTKEQSQAIYDTKGTLLISAAAGSGKTAVLVERAIHLICDENISADSFVIMTFTNASAGELRARITQEIDKRIKQDKNNVFLLKQKMLLNKSIIGTVDSFCKNLVMDNFNLLDIPPDIKIISTAEKDEVSNKAIQEVIEEMYQYPEFIKFTSMYGKSRSDEIAEQTILDLYGYCQTFVNSNKWFEDIIEQYDLQKNTDKNKPLKFLLSEGEKSINYALDLAKEVLEITYENEELEPCISIIENDVEHITKIKEYLQDKEYDKVVLKLSDYKFANFKSKPKCTNPAKEIAKGMRDKYKKILNENFSGKLFNAGLQEHENDFKELLPIIKIIIKACKKYEELLFKMKIEKKALEFSDFEHLTIKLLLNEDGSKSEFAKQLSKRFSTVMVDEYQDTNAIQNNIYENLANDDLSNLFYVGDVKQSIYQFRKADPDIFIKKKDSYSHYVDENIKPATILLKNNFRSCETVIDGINDIFTAIMSKELGSISYNDDEKLSAGSPEQVFEGGKIEFHLVECEPTEEKSDAKYIAKKIKKMYDSGYLVRSKTGNKKVELDDFVILLRSATKIDLYVSALKQLNIPCHISTDNNIFLTDEIQSIISLLRIIDNPGLDVYMVSVLLSPMSNFTEEDLTKLRYETQKGSIYSALLNSNSEKAIKFIKLLKSLSYFKSKNSIHALCKKILKETKFDIIVGAMEQGEFKRENIRAFVKYVKNLNSDGNLSSFLRLVDSVMRKGAGDGTATTISPKGCVNIMSIHKSKGLEFPVCFLANTNGFFNKRDITKPILFDNEFGIGFKLKTLQGKLYPTLTYNAITIKKENEQLSEEMRVLYVALTRAKDVLIMTMADNLEKKNSIINIANEINTWGKTNYFEIKSKRSYGEWLLTAIMQNKNSEILWNYINAENMTNNNFKSNIGIYINPSPLYLISNNENTEIKYNEEYCEKKANELIANFNLKENNINYENTPMRTSVSQISHNQNLETVLQRPSFMYTQGLSPTEKGTAMHSFLQFADFKNAKEDLSKEIMRLVNGQYIRRDVALNLDIENLKKFLNTSLCKEMMECDKLIREYSFLTKIKTNLYDVTQTPEKEIYVQGIADGIIIKNNSAILLDYKTDRNKNEDYFIKNYKTQLQIYKIAIEKKLNIPVKKCVIYSLDLQKIITVFEND